MKIWKNKRQGISENMTEMKTLKERKEKIVRKWEGKTHIDAFANKWSQFCSVFSKLSSQHLINFNSFAGRNILPSFEDFQVGESEKGGMTASTLLEDISKQHFIRWKKKSMGEI